ncbi:allophanate hydrolase [Vibrio sp. V12_P9A6T4]|uniref:5-oxoprolinase subunit B family protein n=1 Tax=Vibrio sp. V12_P9A6T4 TaxID=1938667 RepID=UPI000B8E6E7F|nr:allophanate hydrolase subunit 1 [Vibrio sp. V12_P9A6T4]OXX51785.1 allophanate hydrolase [Vibrio sp. V12_P9A6T4]
MPLNYSIEPVAECSLLLRFNHSPSAELSLDIGQIAQQIMVQFSAYLMNVTPSYTTILIDYLPYRISQRELEQQLITAIAALLLPVEATHNLVELGAYYDESVGPDLKRYHALGLSTQQVIALHTQTVYTVCAVGFAPGFAFMAEVDEQLRLPRHATPRLSVAKGSVAIAEQQTAVYPNNSPGGWNIIANCPHALFSPHQTPMTPFSIGTKVKFTAMTREEFLSLGGEIPQLAAQWEHHS